jgi:hypothetical protein
MSISVAQYLHDHGPSRSSLIVAALQSGGLSAEAARQRVSRAVLPGQSLHRFPIPLLPKREHFLYLQDDRNSERFWRNFLRDLRASGSVFGAAIDGIIARDGLVTVEGFAVISGAPVIPQKGQVSVEIVAKRLIAAGFIKEMNHEQHGPCYTLVSSLGGASWGSIRAQALAEAVLLDGVREWIKKIGMAGYNTVLIRGDENLRPIGPFAFDLAGPSYLLPLQGSAKKPGFVVADVFADGTLTEEQLQYFIRKARMLKANLNGIGVLSILVAEGFTGAALTAGHAAGVMLATPKDLFGKRVGAAITSLVETLKNAAAYASSSPERLTALIHSLLDIEGRAGNLRGVLFELVAGHLARRDAVSIDMGVKATDPETGDVADIDVQKVTSQASAVTAIECKGKVPGGVVQKSEVEKWLGKTAIMRAYYRAHPTFRSANVSFELWTSGTFHPDALALLNEEKARRTKAPINWKDGQAVLALARQGHEKTIADALSQHFIAHPFADFAKQLGADQQAPSAASSTWLNGNLSSGTAIVPAGEATSPRWFTGNADSG